MTIILSFTGFRYQVEAVAKLIGGRQIIYATKSDPIPHASTMISSDVQFNAISNIANILLPDQLTIPSSLLEIGPFSSSFGFSVGKFNASALLIQ